MLRYSEQMKNYIPVDYDSHMTYMTVMFANGEIYQQAYTCGRVEAARDVRRTVIELLCAKDVYAECYATVNGKTHIYEIYN